MKHIEISSLEATTYFWIDRIIAKIKTLKNKENITEEEKQFIKIFENYTEIEWRELYLKLKQLIENETKTLKNNYFVQQTNQTGHNKINEFLKQITQKNIPDLGLALSLEKDKTIFINEENSYVALKINTNFEPKYILTGNEIALNLYKTLLSTLKKIKELDDKFIDFAKLKQTFKEEYKNKNNIEKEKIDEYFEWALQRIYDDNIININHRKNTYSTLFFGKNLKNLVDYEEESNYYSEKILKKN